MGGILTMRQFLSDFPSIDPDSAPNEVVKATRSETQGIAVAAYNLGCFLGAVITIFIGNPLGRKRMIMLGTAVMVIGAILQASATTLPHFIVGRIITGLGNGGKLSRCTPGNPAVRLKRAARQHVHRADVAVRNLPCPQTGKARHDRGCPDYLRYHGQLLD